MDQLWAFKDKVKNHIINNLLTSNVQFVQENLKPWPCHFIWQGHSRLIIIRSYYYVPCVCSRYNVRTDWSA